MPDLTAETLADLRRSMAMAKLLRHRSFQVSLATLEALMDAAAERDALAARLDAAIDVAHLNRQRAWSAETFGPAEIRGHRGILDHIHKELAEIETEPGDVTEWADLILLAFDGAWRSGHSPSDTIAAIKAKQELNEARQWPDWRTADPDKAIEHVRGWEMAECTCQTIRALDEPRSDALTFDLPKSPTGHMVGGLITEGHAGQHFHADGPHKLLNLDH